MLRQKYVADTYCHLYDNGITKFLINSILNTPRTTWPGGVRSYPSHVTCVDISRPSVLYYLHIPQLSTMVVLHGGMTVYFLESPHSSHLRTVVTLRFTVMQEVGPGPYHQMYHPHPTGLTLLLYQDPINVYLYLN